MEAVALAQFLPPKSHLQAAAVAALKSSHVSDHSTRYYDCLSDLSVLECVICVHDAVEYVVCLSCLPCSPSPELMCDQTAFPWSALCTCSICTDRRVRAHARVLPALLQVPSSCRGVAGPAAVGGVPRTERGQPSAVSGRVFGGYVASHTTAVAQRLQLSASWAAWRLFFRLVSGGVDRSGWNATLIRTLFSPYPTSLHDSSSRQQKFFIIAARPRCPRGTMGGAHWDTLGHTDPWHSSLPCSPPTTATAAA
jgi:hypothetical protein